MERLYSIYSRSTTIRPGLGVIEQPETIDVKLHHLAILPRGPDWCYQALYPTDHMQPVWATKTLTFFTTHIRLQTPRRTPPRQMQLAQPFLSLPSFAYSFPFSQLEQRIQKRLNTANPPDPPLNDAP